MSPSVLSNDYRIKYYCGENLNKKICFNKKFLTDTMFLDLSNMGNKNDNEYKKDLINFIEKNKLQNKFKNNIINYCPRDRVELFDVLPTMVKSRLIHNNTNYSILTKMNCIRHFDNLQNLKKEDISFEEKKNSLIWRGSTTGYGFENNIPYRTTSRQTLIEKYCNQESLENDIDVGLTKITQGAINKQDYYKKFLKPTMSRKELLTYKYILSVEGNDVATNLKWILCSNSLLLMPKPQCESWIMESHLFPYVHYVPVKDDFSDLQRQLIWCKRNKKKCKEIIKNANQYMKPFLNKKNENKVMKGVLEHYLKNVCFV
jgi:hypothetical protein